MPPVALLRAPRISGPHVYENRDLYLVHGCDQMGGRKLVPMAQAGRGKVIVRQTGNVSRLTVANLSGQEAYVQAGEIVKGGRQDRVLSSASCCRRSRARSVPRAQDSRRT